MSDTAASTLARILEGLQSGDNADRLGAMHELRRLDYSSPAIVTELEKLAVTGGTAVSRTALDLLDSKINQYVRTQMLKHLKPGERQAILAELQDWKEHGLVQPTEAEVLERRYDFARRPAEAVKAAEVEVPKPPRTQAAARPEVPAAPKPAAPAVPAVPPAPRLTLSQRLFSQATINIALYLGAFLVVGAAAILAALVEVARLPILLGLTILFAAGSLAIKRRLPQPSFILFIVFSLLLPISARVASETLPLTDQLSGAYWASVYVLLTFIWIFGTWSFGSRLLSIAAFAAWSLALWEFAVIFDPGLHWRLLGLLLASLTAVLCVELLKAWKDSAFTRPLFVLAQIMAPIALFVSIGIVTGATVDAPAQAGLWIASALTWLVGAAFYAGSGRIVNFPPFAWLAAVCLFPLSWLTLRIFNVSPETQIIGFAAWGTAFCFGAEYLGRTSAPKVRQYYWPLLLGGLTLFLCSSLDAALQNALSDLPLGYLVGSLLAAGVVGAILMILRSRAYIWLAALIFGLASYFMFFQLPAIQHYDIPGAYQILGASLLLLVPDLFFASRLTSKDSWRWPAFVLGALVTGIGLTLILASEVRGPNAAALAVGVYALLFAAYAVHMDKPWILYLAAASAALALTNALHWMGSDVRLASLTGLAFLYYVAGCLIRGNRLSVWGRTLRISALALGAIISVTETGLIGYPSLLQLNFSGWAVLAISVLFYAETHIGGEDRIEAGGPLFASVAAYLILRQFRVTDLPFHLLAMSLVWLGSDLVFERTLKQRRVASLTRIIGALIAAANLPALLYYGYAANHATQAALVFAVYALFFALDAGLYRRPPIGFAATGSLAFAILLGLEPSGRDLWLPALAGLSAIYFVIGFFIGRIRAEDWAGMLRLSGLAVGAALSVAALVLLKSSGEWYVLLIASLFMAELYLRRENRMEIGPPLLLSVTAYLALHNHGVEELAYHLLAFSLIWLAADVLYRHTLKTRQWAYATRAAGGTIAGINAIILLLTRVEPLVTAICFGVYTLFFALYAWDYGKPRLGYIAAAGLPLAVFSGLRAAHVFTWLYEIVAIAVAYYAIGFLLRLRGRGSGWSQMLLFSGLGLGVVNAVSAPLQTGLDAAIPVAVAATLFAVEAFARRDVWLGFPANALYLESYFLILLRLKVDEPQFFSVGAALLGLLMHYLLTRADARRAAFVTGMFSQLVLLGTSYYQLVSTESLRFFVVIFLEGLAVLGYAVVVRSRSLVIAPIAFIVLSVLSVIYKELVGIATVIMVGCTGVLLLLLGIFAVLQRERITKFGERFSDWQA